MDYKTLMGYGNKKKKPSKSKNNKVLENIKSELNLNIGTLKRIKNLSSDNEQLMNMLDQIKG